MLIGIISDTHDQVLRTKTAVSVLAAHGAQALIHCGDLTIAEVVYECSIQPAYFVFGNCDFDRRWAAVGHRPDRRNLPRTGRIDLPGNSTDRYHAWPLRTRSSDGLPLSSLIISSLAIPIAPRMSRKARPAGSTPALCSVRPPGRLHYSILQPII